MHKKKIIISTLCLLLIIGVCFPNTVMYAAKETVKVATDHINIRQGPGLSYPVVAKAERGDEFTLLAEDGDWFVIQLPNSQKGWVANWLVKKKSNAQNTNGSSKEQTALIKEDGLRIRKGPGTNFQIIGTAEKGQTYTIITTSGSWVQISTPFGNGWVSKDYVNLSQLPKTSNSSASLTGKITTNSLNIRSNPSLDSKIIGKLHNGETVKIISQKGEWTEIDHLGGNAWISSDYVQIGQSTSNETNHATNEQKPSSPSPTSKTGKVTATTLIVRNAGSLNGKAISSVAKGQTFKIIEEVNNWAKIEYKKGSFGWVASWYLDKTGTNNSPVNEEKVKDSTITILHDGSNIRKSANTQSSVVQRANAGDTFKVISVQNDWYEIKLPSGGSGFIAGWIVSVDGTAPKVEKLGSDSYLQNKKIIIDPGHGGRDNGTTGAGGTIEKSLTMQTAKLLYNKLKAAGANVTLTRSNDTYIPLASRVYASHYNNADAFISIHYDSINDRSVRGMTTYYHHSYQKNLAKTIHTTVSSLTNIKDRDYRYGDYYVLRENKRSAILMELGYLSNPAEEMLISSTQYQETVATGIAQGLAKYFKE